VPITRDIGSVLIPALPFAQTVNEYYPGQGIAAHTDTVDAFEDGFSSVSLASQVTMDFASPGGGEAHSVLLPPRSLVVFTGDARYIWTHAIADRKLDRVDGDLLPRGRRVSLTFRKIIPKLELELPVGVPSLFKGEEEEK
jgi:alkylated DNA repair protein alkB family protein 8